MNIHRLAGDVRVEFQQAPQVPKKVPATNGPWDLKGKVALKVMVIQTHKKLSVLRIAQSIIIIRLWLRQCPK